MLKEFREFALKGNVVDLAVGIIIGAAFTAVAPQSEVDAALPAPSPSPSGPGCSPSPTVPSADPAATSPAAS